MNYVWSHVRSNIVGYAALFIAVGGTGYAAISIPRGSVGAAQLRNHAITPVKLDPAQIAGSVHAWAVVRADGSVAAASGGPTVTPDGSFPGVYTLRWAVHLPRRCSTEATIDAQLSTPTETVAVPGNSAVPTVAGYATELGTTTARGQSETTVHTFNQAGQSVPLAFNVAVIC